MELDEAGKLLESKIAAETDGSPESLAWANKAAEAQSILLRVRQVKRQIVDRNLSSENSESSHSPCSRKLSTTLTELRAVDRYERRASSRRDRAMQNALRGTKEI